MLGKKGYVHHALGGVVVGFLLGALIMYLIAKGIIPISLGVCSCP